MLILPATIIVWNQGYFCAFYNQDLCQYRCDQTNNYHNLCEEHGRHMGTATMVNWKPLAVGDYHLFTALLMPILHVKKRPQGILDHR